MRTAVASQFIVEGADLSRPSKGHHRKERNDETALADDWH